MTDQPNEAAPETPAATGPKPPAYVQNRLLEALRGLRGAPRNIWTHMWEQQISAALGTGRVICDAAARGPAQKPEEPEKA